MLAVMLLFIACGLFAQSTGQVGVGSSPVRAHNHSGGSQGGSIAALQIAGNFLDYGNSEGNIVLSTTLSGGVFFWRPKRQAFRAGFSTGQDHYNINVGSYSWAGGYNSSAGNFGLGFGTDAHADGAASVALGYYVRSTAYNSMTFGSGPGFGSPAYAVNSDTGSIQFFPFTITSSTEAMLAMYRDGKARATGVWNFTSTPTINGMQISTYGAVDTTKVPLAGGTMIGTLVAPNVTATSMTITADESIAGNLGIGITNPSAKFHLRAGTDLNFWHRTNGGYMQILGINDSASAFIPVRIDGNPLQLNAASLAAVQIPGALFSVGGSTLTASSGVVTMAETAYTYVNPGTLQKRFGIGTNTPQGTFHVASNAAPADTIVYVSSQNASRIFSVMGSGKVGINMLPAYTLDVTGNVRNTGGYYGPGGYDTDSTDSRFYLQTRDADNSAAHSVQIRQDPALTTAGGRLFTIYNASNELLTFDYLGRLGIKNSAPSYGIDVASAIINTSGSGSGFRGDGSQITGMVVFVSSEAVDGTSVASVSAVNLATATITNRGGRLQNVRAHFTITNAAGAARDYSYGLYKNGVLVEGIHTQTNSGASTEYGAIDVHEASSTAGAVNWSLRMTSSSATGAQSVQHCHVDVYEF